MISIGQKQFRLTDRSAIWLLSLAALLYVLLFSTLAAWKFFNFRYNALDLAIFTQTVANTAAGAPFALTIHPPSYLGDHFSPGLAWLALPYHIFPHPLTLLVLLQFALAAGVFPLYRLARNWLPTSGALAVAGAYLLNPFTQNLSLFEFHFIAFTVPLLLAAANAYQRKKFWHFCGWCGVALLIREDVALILIGFAVLGALQRRTARWVIVPGAAAISWLPLAFAAIRAVSATTSYKFTLYYSWLGDTWLQIIQTLLLDPSRWIPHLLQIGNIEMIGGMLLPFAFLPLAAAGFLVIAAGPLAQILMGQPGGSELILKTQYSALFLPGLWLAFCAALGKYLHHPPRFPRFLAPVASDRRLVLTIIAAAVIYAGLMLGPLPGTLRQIARSGWFSEDSRWQQTLVEKIPPGASVAASYNFLSAVAARPRVAGLNYAFIGRQQLSQLPYALPRETDVILFDQSEFLTYQLQYRSHFLYAEDYPTAAERLRQRLERDGFAVTAVADRYVLMERGATSTTALYRVLDNTLANLQGDPRAVGNGLHFLGFRIGAPAPGPQLPERQLPLQLYWRSDGTAQQNYYFQLLIDDRALPTIYPLGAGLLPVPDWPAGSAIETNYWFARPTARKSARLSIQLFAADAGGLYLAPDLSTEIRVTKKTNLGPPILLGTLAELQPPRSTASP